MVNDFDPFEEDFDIGNESNATTTPAPKPCDKSHILRRVAGAVVIGLIVVVVVVQVARRHRAGQQEDERNEPLNPDQEQPQAAAQAEQRVH